MTRKQAADPVTIVSCHPKILVSSLPCPIFEVKSFILIGRAGGSMR